MSNIVVNNLTQGLDYNKWFKAFAKKHNLIGGCERLIHHKMFKPILLSEFGAKYKQLLEESDLSAFFKYRFDDNDEIFDRLYSTKEDFLRQLFKNI